MAVNRIIYSRQEFSLSLCDLGTSFICIRRPGLTPKGWIQRNAAAPRNGMRVADSSFCTLVIHHRIQSNSATGNFVS